MGIIVSKWKVSCHKFHFLVRLIVLWYLMGDINQRWYGVVENKIVYDGSVINEWKVEKCREKDCGKSVKLIKIVKIIVQAIRNCGSSTQGCCEEKLQNSSENRQTLLVIDKYITFNHGFAVNIYHCCVFIFFTLLNPSNLNFSKTIPKTPLDDHISIHHLIIVILPILSITTTHFTSYTSQTQIFSNSTSSHQSTRSLKSMHFCTLLNHTHMLHP